MQLKTLKQAEAALQPFIPSVAEIVGRNITLERMWPMMKILGNPQKRLRIVHIAGTSGKTSTAYFLSSLLAATGKKTALHVSPHIDKLTERTQINNKPITDELFCEEMSIFLNIIYKHNLKPTYFELHTAFAYWFFERQKVDYVVMETGMGGLHDSTNVANNADKICVITDIGLDHTNILGKTIPEITAQKAGIIHSHNAVFMYRQSDEVMRIIADHCKRLHAQLHELEQESDANLTDLPLFQMRNFGLAKAVYEYIKEQDLLSSLSAEDLRQAAHIKIPARMEIIKYKNKILIMDGAHNEQKMQMFVKSFQTKFPNQKAVVLLSLKDSKDYKPIVDRLVPIDGQFITTTFETSQDLPVRSMNSDLLAKYCNKKGVSAYSITDHHQAFQTLMKSNSDLLIITGSFYLLYQLRGMEKII